MKVLLVNKYFYRKGGSETYFLSLGKALQDAGHNVIWFSMQHPQNLPCDQSQYFVKNVDYNGKASPLKRLGDASRLLYSYEAKRNFEKLVLAQRPDIVHLNNVHRQITLSVVDVCEKYNIPVVATVHDWIYVCPAYQRYSRGEICRRCEGKKYINCVLRSCVKNSRSKSLLAAAEAVSYRMRRTYDKIGTYIVPSVYLCEELNRCRFTKSPVIHIRNFLEKTPPQTNNANDGDLFFLFAGRLSYEKGLDVLIKAYAEAKPIPRLLIVGDGPDKAELTKLVESLGIKDRVSLPGAKYGEELLTLQNNSLAMILSSVWEENCPYGIMEALAAGKPVIASKIGGIPELVDDGLTGYLFDPGNSSDLAKKMLMAAALSPEDRKNMGERARARAKAEFSPETHLKQLIPIYTRLISGAKK